MNKSTTNKTNSLIRYIVACILVVISVSTSQIVIKAAKQHHPDYSGVWERDHKETVIKIDGKFFRNDFATESEVIENPSPFSTLIVKQDEKSLIHQIKKLLEKQSFDISSPTKTFKFNEKDETEKDDRINTKTVKVINDKKIELKEVSKTKDGLGTDKSIEIWELTNDGKTLKIYRKTTSESVLVIQFNGKEVSRRTMSDKTEFWFTYHKKIETDAEKK